MSMILGEVQTIISITHSSLEKLGNLVKIKE